MDWLLGPLQVVFVLSGLFLILVVLVQTSRGTGVAGMFGGGGQSSAFGTQTGSLLAKLTAVAAGVFLVTALAYALIDDTSAAVPEAQQTHDTSPPDPR